MEVIWATRDASLKPLYRAVCAGRFDPLRGMSQAAITAIARHQPCFTADPELEVFLNVLREMSNFDKHRRLHLLAASSSMIGFTHVPGEVIESDLHVGPIEPGTVIARVRGPKDYVHLHFTLSIVIDEPDSGAYHRPADYVLSSICNQVEKIVLHFSEAFRVR